MGGMEPECGLSNGIDGQIVWHALPGISTVLKQFVEILAVHVFHDEAVVPIHRTAFKDVEDIRMPDAFGKINFPSNRGEEFRFARRLGRLADEIFFLPRDIE